MSKLVHRSLLAGSIMALVAACGGNDEPGTASNGTTETVAERSAPAAARSTSEMAFLSRIEHDTPYLLAYDFSAMDRDLLNYLLNASSEAMVGLQKQLEANAEGDDPMQKLAMAVLDEFAHANNIEAIERLGLDGHGQMSLSAIGIMPVLRWSLSDQDAFMATVERIAAKAEMPMPEPKTHGDHQYWQIPIADSAVIIGLGDNWVNAGHLADLEDEQALETILGLRAPERSLADAGTVTDINSRYGFDGISVAYVAVQDILNAITDEGDNRIKSSITGLVGETELVPSACHGFVRAVGSTMPRIVSGSFNTTSNAMDTRSVVEFTGNTPSNLQAMAATVPGMGVASEQSLARLSLALDQSATRTVLNNLTAGLRSVSEGCPWVEESTLRNIDQSAMQLGNPMFASVKGLHVDFQSLDIMPGMMMPSDVRAHALIAADNPLGLLGLAAMASPGLAQLDIQTNGEPVALGPDIIPPLVPAPHLAASDKALAMSVGEGHQDGLGDFLSGAAADKAMLLRVSYDARQIADMMKEQMEAAAQGDPEAAAAMQAFDGSQFTVFDWIEIQVFANEHGLVVDQFSRIRN